MFEVTCGFMFAVMVAAYEIPAAALERGYIGACGGEWILIYLAAVVGVYLGYVAKVSVKKIIARLEAIS